MDLKTYYPIGFIEWLEESKICYDTDIIMDLITYNGYILDLEIRNIIFGISEFYNGITKEIINDNFKYIFKYNKKYEIPIERSIYDPLVANIICKFWLQLINQPRETIKEYYKQNKLDIHSTFELVEAIYDLTDFCPSYLIINVYKLYYSY